MTLKHLQSIIFPCPSCSIFFNHHRCFRKNWSNAIDKLQYWAYLLNGSFFCNAWVQWNAFCKQYKCATTFIVTCLSYKQLIIRNTQRGILDDDGRLTQIIWAVMMLSLHGIHVVPELQALLQNLITVLTKTSSLCLLTQSVKTYFWPMTGKVQTLTGMGSVTVIKDCRFSTICHRQEWLQLNVNKVFL